MFHWGWFLVAAIQYICTARFYFFYKRKRILAPARLVVIANHIPSLKPAMFFAQEYTNRLFELCVFLTPFIIHDPQFTQCAADCSSVVVAGFGLSSGTYREIVSSYDAHYYMAAGIDYHELFLSSGAWYIEPGVAYYPTYRVSQIYLILRALLFISSWLSVWTCVGLCGGLP